MEGEEGDTLHCPFGWRVFCMFGYAQVGVASPKGDGECSGSKPFFFLFTNITLGPLNNSIR